MPDDSVGDSGSSIDNRHLLLVGAGPGLGMALARRFADGGYGVTLVARSRDGLGRLADSLADTGAQIDEVEADASDPEGLRARMVELYDEPGAPGLIIYNAVMGAPDQLLSSSVEHLQTAYAVDVISAIVVTQVASPAMRAAGSGTIIVTGGGFGDHPIPALASISLGKAALRSAATMLGADLEPDASRVATLTIAGQIVAGTAFDPENIAIRYWEVVHSDGPWRKIVVLANASRRQTPWPPTRCARRRTTYIASASTAKRRGASLATPFLLAGNGVLVEETEPWQ
jgi:short-subunit dehydrogenase